MFLKTFLDGPKSCLMNDRRIYILTYYLLAPQLPADIHRISGDAPHTSYAHGPATIGVDLDSSKCLAVCRCVQFWWEWREDDASAPQIARNTSRRHPWHR